MLNNVVTEDYLKSLKDPIFISTGMDFLDEILGGGLVTGSLVMVQAPSGVGKTSFLMNLTMQVMKQGKRVFYLSAGEQDFQEVLERFTSLFADQSYMFFKQQPREWRNERIRRFIDKYGDLLDTVYSDDPLRMIDGQTELNVLFTKANIEDCVLFVYDYIGSTPAPSQEAEYSYLGSLAGTLKNLAKQNGMIVATAMQTNRALLQELRGFDPEKTAPVNEAFTSKSVIVPQKSTLCITLFRANQLYYLDIFKNRQNGITGRHRISINKNTFEMKEVPLVPIDD